MGVFIGKVMEEGLDLGGTGLSRQRWDLRTCVLSSQKSESECADVASGWRAVGGHWRFMDVHREMVRNEL
jgi:hypothetical protein